MPETRHRTVLEIGVDDREVRRLGQALDRALDPRLLQTFERMVERSTRQMEKLVSVTDRMGRAAEAIARSQAGSGRAGRAAMASGAGAAVGSYLGTRAAQRQGGPGFFQRQHGRAQALGGAAARYAPVSEGWMGQALHGIPYIGPLLGSTLAGAQQYYQQYAAYQQNLAGAMGGAGVGNAGMRIPGGIGFGFGPNAQAQLMAQFAQSSGTQGGGLQAVAPQLMALQRYYGMNSAGNILGAFNVGTGNQFSEGQNARGGEIITDMIAAGFQAGIRGARLDTYLASVAGFAEQARMGGMDIAPESMAAMVRVAGGLGTAGSGWRGRAGVQAMTNIAGALRNAPQGQGMFSMLALRAAGYTGRPGGQSLMQAQMRLEEEPGEVIPELFRMMLERGGSREATAFAIQNIMREGGVNLSTRQVLSLAARDPASIRAAGPEAAREMFEQDLADRSGRMGFGGAAHGARMEAQRIDIGRQVRQGVEDLQNLEITLVRRFLPQAMRLVQGVTGAARRIVSAYDSGGWGAAFQEMTSIFASAIIENLVPEEAREAVRSHFGEHASDAASALRRLQNDPNTVIPFTGNDTMDRGLSSGLRTFAPALIPLYEGVAEGTRADQPPPPPSDPSGPTSSAAELLRQGAYRQLQAADELDRMNLPAENMLETAVG